MANNVALRRKTNHCCSKKMSNDSNDDNDMKTTTATLCNDVLKRTLSYKQPNISDYLAKSNDSNDKLLNKGKS